MQESRAATVPRPDHQTGAALRNGAKVEATPARDVKYLQGADRPKVYSGPPGMSKVIGKKNPLNVWEIEGRAFSAKMLPPQQSASGFFYFQTELQKGATVYLNGLKESGADGQDLFYFEVPLD
jgi:hypothetical protein